MSATPPAIPSVDQFTAHRHTTAKSGLRLLWVLLPVFLIGGCQATKEPLLKEIKFNPVLRRDLEELSDNQKNRRLSPFYGAQQPADETLTELYPVPEGYESRQDLSDLLKTLRRSDFYYAPPGEQLRASWEVVGELDSQLKGCNTYMVGGCSLTDPETRVALRCNDTLVHLAGWDAAIQTSLEIKKFSLPNQGPFAPLQIFNQSLGVAATLCANKTQNHPFCQMDCDLAAATGTYHLSVTISDGSTSLMATKEMKPTVLVPELNAPINRVMREEPTPSPVEPQPSPSPRIHTMVWSTDTNADNTWKENYSPSFSISRVRVLARNRSTGATQQVDVGQMKIFGEQTNVLGGELPKHTCDPDPELQEFTPRGCDVLPQVTPTYRHVERDQRVIWKIDVPENGADGSRNFEETDDLFIEFVLAGPVGTNSGGLTAASAPLLVPEPQSLSVGFLTPNVESRFENSIVLINTSDRPLTLRRFRISSLTHGQVAVELPGESSMPSTNMPERSVQFVIFPGTFIPLRLRVSPDATNGLFRTVTFTYDDGDVNSPREGRFNVGGRTYISVLDVTPATFQFEPGAQHYFLAMNSGPAPLTITSAEFRGVSRRSFTLANTSQFPLTLNGFTHQRVYIQYQPQMVAGLAGGSGTQNATLELTSDAGNKRVTLMGSTSEEAKAVPRLKTTIALKPRSWWR